MDNESGCGIGRGRGIAQVAAHGRASSYLDRSDQIRPVSYARPRRGECLVLDERHARHGRSESNYAAFGKWCVSKNLLTDANHFVNNPGELAADRWAWHGAVWYWTVARPTLNASATAAWVAPASTARTIRSRRSREYGLTLRAYGTHQSHCKPL